MSFAPALEDRVAALEQLISARTPDQLQANPITVQPDGTTRSSGLALTAETSDVYPPPQYGAVAWLDAADGAKIATVHAVSAGTQKAVKLSSIATALDDGPTVVLQAINALGVSSFSLSVDGTGDNSTGGVTAHIGSGGGSNDVRIIGRDHTSAFLQLLSAQQLQLSFGAVTVTWAGGQQFSTSMIQPHGLGRAPVAVHVTTEAAFYACWAQLIGASDATNIHFNAQAPSLPAAGSTAVIHWTAIG